MSKVMVHQCEQNVSGQEGLVDTGEAWRIRASGIGPNSRGGLMDCSCSSTALSRTSPAFRVQRLELQRDWARERAGMRRVLDEALKRGEEAKRRADEEWNRQVGLQIFHSKRKRSTVMFFFVVAPCAFSILRRISQSERVRVACRPG